MNQPLSSVPRPPLGTLFKILFDNFRDLFLMPKPVKFRGILSDLTNPDKLVIVYLGHATVFINLLGTTILTDPVFGRYSPFFPRYVESGLTIDMLPRLDFVVISHAHFDHLHRKSLRALAKKTKTLIIPKNVSDVVNDLGFFKIVELDWEQNLNHNPLKIMAFQPEHWGSRLPWERVSRGYNSYIFSKNNKTIIFAGDTAYSENFKNIAQEHSIDIVILPIGAYNPLLFQRFHLSPQSAVQVFEETQAKYLIPIHWGTFRLSLEPLDEPPQLVKKAMRERLITEKLKLLEPGEIFEDR